MYGGQGQQHIFLYHSPLYFLRLSLSQNLDFNDSVWFPSQQVAEIHLPVSTSPAETGGAGHLVWLSYMGTRDQIQVLMLVEQALYWLSHLPSPFNSLKILCVFFIIKYTNSRCSHQSNLLKANSSWQGLLSPIPPAIKDWHGYNFLLQWSTHCLLMALKAGKHCVCRALWKNETHLLRKTSFPSIYRLWNHSKYTIPSLQLSTTHFPSIDKLPCQQFLFKSFLNKNILKDFHYWSLISNKNQGKTA